MVTPWLKSPETIEALVSCAQKKGFSEARLIAYRRWLEAGDNFRAGQILRKQVCGARRRYSGLECLAKPWHRGRCKWHGGGPTPRGPRTLEGRERCRQAALEAAARRRELNPRPKPVSDGKHHGPKTPEGRERCRQAAIAAAARRRVVTQFEIMPT
jgi:hypothetical protein